MSFFIYYEHMMTCEHPCFVNIKEAFLNFCNKYPSLVDASNKYPPKNFKN